MAPVSAHLLIVDDEPELLELMASEFTEQGYAVQTAENGSQGLAHIQAAEFDVVLSDIRMPVVDGVTFLKGVRELYPETEVIVATGYASLETAVECLRAGAFDFVQKPFHMTELFATVARALERRRLRAQTALYESCRIIFAAGGGETLPARIVEVAMKVMGADDVSLMLPDNEGQLYVAHSHGLSSKVRDETRVRVGDRVSGRVAEDRTPVILQSTLQEDGRFANLESFRDIHSSIVYPLVSGDKVVGVLNLNRLSGHNPFRTWDLSRVAVLASQVVLALENVRLVKRLISSEKLAAVGQVAAGVAHEINNPISYVLCNLIDSKDRLERLRQVPMDPAATSLVEEIQQATTDALEGATRIREIVNDMRALSRADEGPPGEFDLNDAIRGAARVTGAELRARAQLTMDLEGTVRVRGNLGRLSQVFMNLLVNAAQAVGEDGPAAQSISVTTRSAEGRAVVEIRDSGCGIASGDLDRVFEPFFTTKPVGTGLGLSISREIVRKMGGEITVRSEVGTGTRFTVSLPLCPENDAAESGTHQVIEPLVVGSAPARLLFIDDEAGIRRYYRRAFEEGYEIVLAENGREALRVLAESPQFQRIICDLHLPDCNGVEVYRQAVALYPELASRFIFVTGGGLRLETQTFLKGLPNLVIEKPFEFSQLRSLIGQDFPRSAPPPSRTGSVGR